MHALSVFGRLTTWVISSVSQDSASSDIPSLCRRPGSGDAHRVATCASTTRPFSAFPRDYRNLPTVAFVSPNMRHGMHDCSVRTGDRWMKEHFDRYARWAERHNSLLIVTFDENAGGSVKPIFT